jgi:hypothetical protein
MNGRSAQLLPQIEELSGVLKKDIEHIERTLSYLGELRVLVIKRDVGGLTQLLEQIQAESQDYSAIEKRRQTLRGQLAESFGCKPKEMTLSVIRERISKTAGMVLAESQQKLAALAVRLKSEYITTAAMLTECARINSLLLKIVFERSRPGLVCYDSQGATKRESSAAFMSLRL